jgi:putative acyl-CoA dehydrogenase
MTASPFATHEVFNQTPSLGDMDLWNDDPALQGAVRAFGRLDNELLKSLTAFGERWGTAEMAEFGRLANENPPKLRTYDPHGYRADRVEFHPAYHALMRESMAAGIHCSTWGPDGKLSKPGAFVARAARQLMSAEVEQGHQCPIVMTHAATGALLSEPSLLKEWLPKIRSREYDPAFQPADMKASVTLGMGMTEKQGGSDVRANTTRAEPDGDAYRITGHKWFFSAPMSDAFLVLAQANDGLTCFLMPRFQPDGRVNALRLRRLKDKLGNRSNASSEVEFQGAYARRCGPEGEGIKTIIGMVALTRLDCVIGALGILRAALLQAIHHARFRMAFQKKLIDQPLMRAVLADLALEREGATALGFRLAKAFDNPADPDEALFARLMTPAAKLYVCKAVPGFVYETLECLGGNGYIEENSMARLYREAPLNAIWEGSGNIMALDLLRGIAREPEGFERVLRKLAKDTNSLPGVDAAVARIQKDLTAPDRESLARRATETFALLGAAAALVTSAPSHVAETFALRRLHGIPGRNYSDPVPDALAEELFPRSFSRAA